MGTITYIPPNQRLSKETQSTSVVSVSRNQDEISKLLANNNIQILTMEDLENEAKKNTFGDYKKFMSALEKAMNRDESEIDKIFNKDNVIDVVGTELKVSTAKDCKKCISALKKGMGCLLPLIIVKAQSMYASEPAFASLEALNEVRMVPMDLVTNSLKQVTIIAFGTTVAIDLIYDLIKGAYIKKHHPSQQVLDTWDLRFKIVKIGLVIGLAIIFA